MKLSREKVFELIDDEREYQNSKWHIDKQKEYTLSEWVTMMKKYVNEAENSIFDGDDEKARFAILKLSALGVASLEQMGCCINRKKIKE